jgi:hypothetical protein
MDIYNSLQKKNDGGMFKASSTCLLCQRDCGRLLKLYRYGWTRQKRKMASNRVDVIDLSVDPSEAPKLFAWIAGSGLYSDRQSHCH